MYLFIGAFNPFALKVIVDALGKGLGRWRNWSKQEKKEEELINIDNSVVIVVGEGGCGSKRGYRGDKW